MPYIALEHNDEYRAKIKSMGYEPTELGLARLIRDKLKEMTLGQLCRKLNISRGTLRHHINKHGIKNPNGPGGANNPHGIKGKSGIHRSIEKGMM